MPQLPPDLVPVVCIALTMVAGMSAGWNLHAIFNRAHKHDMESLRTQCTILLAESKSREEHANALLAETRAIIDKEQARIAAAQADDRARQLKLAEPNMN